MSGGMFNYNQYILMDTIEMLEESLTDPLEHLSENDRITTHFHVEETLWYMKGAYARLHALDWAMSADTDINDFRKHVNELLKENAK